MGRPASLLKAACGSIHPTALGLAEGVFDTGKFDSPNPWAPKSKSFDQPAEVLMKYVRFGTPRSRFLSLVSFNGLNGLAMGWCGAEGVILGGRVP